MSGLVDPVTNDFASNGEIKTVNDAPACLLNCEASDVTTDVHVVELCDDDDGTSFICTDSVDTACEPQNSGPKILESLDSSSRHITYINIHVDNSTDISFGTKAIFNDPVIIQQVNQLVVTGDTQVVNQQQLPNNEIAEAQIQSVSICDRSISITIKSIFLLGALIGVYSAIIYVEINIRYVSMCKTNGTDTCSVWNSVLSCSNLLSFDDRPYISGYTFADVCNIFSERDCLGDMQEIGTNHTIFDFKAVSVGCKRP